MPSLLDMRRRIKSVKNTQQITKAMKMVAAAKLKRAQDAVVAARPYSQKMAEVLGNLSANAGDFSHPLLDERGDENYLIVLVTADKGLCGGFNTNLMKAAQNFMGENPGKKFEMMPVGRKARDYFKRREMDFVEEYLGVTAKARVDYSEAKVIAEKVITTFVSNTSIDKVFLVFAEFKSVLTQNIITEQLLPIVRNSESAGETKTSASGTAEYIYEQPAAEIFGRLLPKQVETQIYRALLESIASEQGARMTAMDSASKNAGELIGSLTLTMNRIRQAAITKEIIEVVSGAAAL
jgi:F-type H+-transporting ATPase subunit gamma